MFKYSNLMTGGVGLYCDVLVPLFITDNTVFASFYV